MLPSYPDSFLPKSLVWMKLLLARIQDLGLSLGFLRLFRTLLGSLKSMAGVCVWGGGVACMRIVSAEPSPAQLCSSRSTQ